MVLLTLEVLFLTVTFLIVAIAFYKDFASSFYSGVATILRSVEISLFEITPDSFYVVLAISST